MIYAGVYAIVTLLAFGFLLRQWIAAEVFYVEKQVVIRSGSPLKPVMRIFIWSVFWWAALIYLAAKPLFTSEFWFKEIRFKK